MNSKTETAAQHFLSGFNCAQSILLAYCEDYGLDSEAAAKIASGLGAGCRIGELCGAVTGAVLVIGLKYGQSDYNDTGAKANCSARTSQFIDELRTRMSHVKCRDILGYDITTEEGMLKSREMDRRTSPCAEAVRCAAEILAELGY